MNTIFDFIQRIIKDLKLGEIGPNMQKTMELRIGEIVDEQIEGALTTTLTKDDWQIYKKFIKDHPDADKNQAFDAMLTNRPELRETIEDTLMDTYEDIMMRGDAVSEEMKNLNESNEA